jgi:hypothetical protein
LSILARPLAQAARQDDTSVLLRDVLVNLLTPEALVRVRKQASLAPLYSLLALDEPDVPVDLRKFKLSFISQESETSVPAGAHRANAEAAIAHAHAVAAARAADAAPAPRAPHDGAGGAGGSADTPAPVAPSRPAAGAARAAVGAARTRMQLEPGLEFVRQMEIGARESDKQDDVRIASLRECSCQQDCCSGLPCRHQLALGEIHGQLFQHQADDRDRLAQGLAHG